MATDSAVRSCTNTLSGTTADTITLTQAWPSIDVTNHDSADIIYFRQDGVTAVAAADGCSVLLPGQSKVAAASITSSGTIVISIVGDGGAYTIEGVN
jgi:hypothetical protein